MVMGITIIRLRDKFAKTCNDSNSSGQRARCNTVLHVWLLPLENNIYGSITVYSSLFSHFFSFGASLLENKEVQKEPKVI